MSASKCDQNSPKPGRLEAGAESWPKGTRYTMSAAVSLKRIADALTTLASNVAKEANS